MRRVLLQSAAFVRAARRLAKRHPESAAFLQAALAALALVNLPNRALQQTTAAILVPESSLSLSTAVRLVPRSARPF